ncbi:DUF4129 domain-containing protein [Kovacikia minuta CCNUW1]|uniref:DUF4129 domain-containing protein n=1 Tax=Kovacikia minuta TaxID=2931930 RepID=UPI001CCA42ED|nr:DUF4129 domain-containing protein [Kovacikia minuta]UBF26927.1 DUF4129 domain-containing protein [Kovacikia minuta CCNUW1]
MTASYEITSLGWQIQQLQQRIGEWLERILTPVGTPPIGEPPEWLVKAVFWGVSLVLIGWVSQQLYTLLRFYFYPSLLTESSPGETPLPPPKALTVEQWLQRSRTFARQGNYREACRSLYLAALERLNEDDLIPQELSRTDGEYHRLLQTIPNASPYQLLIHTHEQLCFGHAEISAETYDHCQRSFAELERKGAKKKEREGEI